MKKIEIKIDLQNLCHCIGISLAVMSNLQFFDLYSKLGYPSDLSEI